MKFLRQLYYRFKIKKPSRLLRIRPARQIKSTCWLYAAVNLITHSRILKKNIKHAILLRPKFQNNINTARKMNFKIHENACITKKMAYYKILKDISRESITENSLKNFAMNLVNNKSNNILIKGGHSENALEEILFRFGLPEDTISYRRRPGYRLEGSLISVNLPNRNKGHAITGTFDRFGRPVIMDSASGLFVKLDWTKPDFYKKFYKIYSGANMFPHRINKNNVNNIIMVYVKKLY